MKSIFYVLLLGVVVSCTKPALIKNNDLEKENLKGKVKSTYTEERFVKKKNGKPYFHGKIINKRIQCFNEYGLNTYTCDSEPGDKSESRSEYKFDNQNRIKKQIDAFDYNFLYEMDYYYSKNCTSILLNVNDRFDRKTIQLYKQNRLVRTNYFIRYKNTHKFSIDTYVTYSYNKHKQDSIITCYKFSKKLNAFVVYSKDKYLYDSKTHELVFLENYGLWYHHEDPANVESKHHEKFIFKDYQYKYDKQGNWIEKIVQVNGVLKGYKRKINYYV